eukprot:CAMPEP_0178462394 /NCGR_PEP_ID=MMETSP0689_2-20121128/49801_1 /TAXON_ID=160604 /ORGANISM="Amphidinium massartii, Strain CS-259" /LENGTH=104 /DNA_ID=CAMNT_0020089257 /DNA_START=350 /DNA_END=664 /DNA_ORIENTATION=-
MKGSASQLIWLPKEAFAHIVSTLVVGLQQEHHIEMSPADASHDRWLGAGLIQACDAAARLTSGWQRDQERSPGCKACHSLLWPKDGFLQLTSSILRVVSRQSGE